MRFLSGCGTKHPVCTTKSTPNDHKLKVGTGLGTGLGTGNYCHIYGYGFCPTVPVSHEFFSPFSYLATGSKCTPPGSNHSASSIRKCMNCNMSYACDGFAGSRNSFCMQRWKRRQFSHEDRI